MGTPRRTHSFQLYEVNSLSKFEFYDAINLYFKTTDYVL